MKKAVGTNHEGKTIYLTDNTPPAGTHYRDGEQVGVSYFTLMLKHDLEDVDTGVTNDYIEALRVLESGQEIHAGRNEYDMHTYRIRGGAGNAIQ